MKLKLVKIGNSIGVRLPKAILRNYNFQDEVEAEVQEEGIFLKPTGGKRTLWKDLFQSDIQQNPVREKGEWEW